MSIDADLEAWLRLSLLPGLGHQSLRKLLVALGSPANILAASHRELSSIVSEKTAIAIRNGGADPASWKDVESWLDDPANHIITLADTAYPQALLEIPDPPPLIYVKGRLDLLNLPGFAIVGSRNATAQGL